jgi:hypothetical protein
LNKNSLKYYCDEIRQTIIHDDMFKTCDAYESQLNQIKLTIQDVDNVISNEISVIKLGNKSHINSYPSYISEYINQYTEQLKYHKNNFTIIEEKTFSDILSSKYRYNLPKDYELSNNSDRLLLDQLKEKIDEFFILIYAEYLNNKN